MRTSDFYSFPSRPHAPIFLGASVALQLALAGAAVPVSAGPRTDLGLVRSWGYQLQQIEPAAIAATQFDLVAIDYSRDGTADFVFGRADVAAMQITPSGGRRLVLAYLSIGEAEDYRYYWQKGWNVAPPSWLGEENPDWPGNYAVRFWDEDWQSLIFGSPGAYLDQILAAGFDGIYLDRIDAFDVPVPQMPRADRMQMMSAFVVSLADYARQRHPGFVVIGQNGEELLGDAPYATAIDAVAKEDLFFGLNGDGVINQNAELRASLTPLQRFQSSGKPVFVVEYLDSPPAVKFARERAAALGAPIFIGDRELDDVRSR